MKRIFLLLIIICVLVLGVIFCFVYRNSQNENDFSAIITKEEMLEELSKIKDNYQGTQDGTKVKYMLLILEMSIPNKYIQKKAPSPIVEFNNETQIIYEDDFQKYVNEIGKLIRNIDDDKILEVEILTNSNGFPTEIKIQDNQNSISTAPEELTLDDIKHIFEQYEGSQKGYEVRAMVSKVSSIALAHEELTPIVSLNKEEIRYDGDLKKYRNDLNNLRKILEAQNMFNVKVLYNDDGFASEIVIEEK